MMSTKNFGWKRLSPGSGNLNGRVLFISEQPRAEYLDVVEEKTETFPEKVFRHAILDSGIDINDCYFTTVLKYPLPSGRKPTWAEVESSCMQLFMQIEDMDPWIIVPVGQIAYSTLTQDGTNITKVRGSTIIKRDRYIMPVHDPKFSYRSRIFKSIRNDMLKISKVYQELRELEQEGKLA